MARLTGYVVSLTGYVVSISQTQDGDAVDWEDVSMYETFRRDLHELKEALLTAVDERAQRAVFDQASGEFGWVLHERRVMLDATNRIRTGRGLPPVGEEAIIQAETSASGHIDYAQKFAVGCAELANDITVYRAVGSTVDASIRRSLDEKSRLLRRESEAPGHGSKRA